MTWLTWRQFRFSALPVFGLLAALLAAIVLVQVPDVAHETLIRDLVAGGATITVYTVVLLAIVAMPAVIGAFWGAPLVARELEAGTHRFVWAQSISRGRWLVSKVGLVGLAAIAGAAIVSLLFTWWCAPIDRALNAGLAAQSGPLGLPRMDPLIFNGRGIVPIGYTAFAFALGVAAGTVLRRTVPAMAITLAIVAAVQIAWPQLVRPNLFATTYTTEITAENVRGMEVRIREGSRTPEAVRGLRVEVDQPGAWVPVNQTLDRAGNALSALPSWVASCVPAGELGPPPGERIKRDPNCWSRLTSEGYRQQVSYIPANRFWALQAVETAIFLGLALLLAGGTFWWVRNRIT